jgi:hypothetical protein
LLGCEKIKSLAATDPHPTVDKLGGPADPALAGLVRRSDAGLMLRKDLPLPASFKVNWERSDEVTSAHRVAYGTEPGRPSEAARESIAQGKFFSKATLQRLTPERYSLNIPALAAPEPPKKGKTLPPPPVMAAGEQLAGSSVTLLRDQGAWRVAKPTGSVDFKSLNWGTNLTPHFDALLRRSNLTTSPRWLGDPLVAGKQITLSGGDAAILLGSPAAGELVLRFEGEQSLGGHPCAVFSITGRYQTEPALHWHGGYESEEMVVESGHVYLSALYPLVLGVDLDGIVSLSTWTTPGGKGKPATTLQGRTHRKVRAIPEFPQGWSPQPVSGAGS